MEETKRFFWKTCQLTERDRRNQWRYVGWSLAWTTAWVVASIAINNEWVGTGTPQLVIALLPTVLGVGMLLAYAKFLREADELQRKIQLDALALGFGAGLVGSVLYRLLQRTVFVAEADVADVIVLMIVVYAIAVLIGQRRYA